MKHNIFKDPSFLKALSLVEEEKVNALPKEDSSHTYSAEYKEKMERLLKTKSKPFKGVFKNTKRKVATALIALLLSFNLVLIVNADIRNSVAAYFLEIHDDFAIINFQNTNSGSGASQNYIPSYVPEGYEIVNLEEYVVDFYFDYHIRVDYENSEGDKISYFQTGVQGFGIGIDTKEHYEEILIYGNEAILFGGEDGGDSQLFLNSGSSMHIFYGTSRDEIIKMAESLVPYSKDDFSEE